MSKFYATLSQKQIEYFLKNKILPVTVAARHASIVERFGKRLWNWQEEKGEQREFEIIIHEKRTVDQIKLSHCLYSVEAHEQNAGCLGDRSMMVTKDELYEADIDQWGEIEEIKTTVKRIPEYATKYRRIYVYIPGGDYYNYRDQKVKDMVSEMDPKENTLIKVTRGMSMMTIAELSQWINGQFNRLATDYSLSMDSGDQVKQYWDEWRIFLNDNKIILHEEKLLTIREYKELQPICEATGKTLGFGTDNYCGELSHIVGFGMGGDRSKEDHRTNCINWMHLDAEVHRREWHDKGEKFFLEKYPHLAYKVKRAKRNEKKEDL